VNDFFLQVTSFLYKVGFDFIYSHSGLLILFDIGLERLVEILKVRNNFEVLMEFLVNLGKKVNLD
jgi:hypothetical protein